MTDKQKVDLAKVCIIFIVVYLIVILPNVPVEILKIFMILLSLAGLFVLLLLYLFNIKTRKIKNDILINSEKIKLLKEIDKKYNFKKIKKIHREIIQREYSLKSLDRITAEDIIKYHIENNIDDIRTDIENAIINKKMYSDYNAEVNILKRTINVSKSINNPTKIYEFTESKIFDSLIFNDSLYNLSLRIEAYYQSYGGRRYEVKISTKNFEELKDLYTKWYYGKKYEITAKQERLIMNDEIRYNVLKRDNYTCKICGASASDGIRLHVDHIIPVSEGGKTNMMNLQTLCDRCNMGKSNKTDKDFINNLICPSCGAKLVERNSKKGKFYGCSRYPKCHYIRNIK